MSERVGPQIKRVYIDCDGVLADFDGWKAAIPGLTDANLWEEVKKIPHFYRTLRLMPEATLLMEYLRGLDIPLAILTAIPRRDTIPDAEQDKREWVEKNFGPMEFHIGPYAVNKQQFAGPGLVLIDDSKLNIQQWRAKGGIGILYTGFMPCYDQFEQIRRET